MRKLGPRPRRMGWSLLWSALACLGSGTALAAPIADYITVQPIDVCGAVCSPINNLGAGKNIWSNAPAGDVGFVDPSGVNVTRAIWNQIGVDVTYMTTAATTAAAYVNGSFLTLNVDAASNPLTSTAFKTLSQQDAISTGAVPNPTSPPGVPVSKNATTINAFFTGKLNPATGSLPLWGFGWIGNNGVAIPSGSLLGAAARPDSFAHELGHDLGLDHTTFGAGGPANLMTAGATRTIPRTANPLGTLGTTTDQLNAMQKSQVLLSGFMNPVPNINTPVMDPVASNDFKVSFASNTGRLNEKLDKLTLTAPADSLFEPNTEFKLQSNPNGLTVRSSLNDCGVHGCSSLAIDFTGGAPFVAGDGIDYSLCDLHNGSCVPVAIDDLAGGTYTYNFETDVDGAPAELFQTTSELTGAGDLASGSWFPDLSIPSRILNPDTFIGFGAMPCTLLAGSCPPLVLADADPVEDNPAVPEPPSIWLLLVALAVLTGACRYTPPRRRLLEAGLAQPL